MLKKRLLLIVGLSGLIIVASVLVNYRRLNVIGSQSATNTTITLPKSGNRLNEVIESQLPVQSQSMEVGLPVRLNIPSINVNVSIEQVGLTSEGAMDVSKGPVNVAWFNLGPLPGHKGSAVIAGHSGRFNHIPAVFDNLHKLKKGDKINVIDQKGINIVFVVRETKIYDKNQDAADVFGSDDGKAHLNLITCIGFWDKVNKSRANRLIVFTDMTSKDERGTR